MSQSTAKVAPKENTRGRVLFASMIGTTVEFFDFYAYATASVLVFPALFFPTASNINAILSSFAIFGVAFLARPLGSIILGHYGDKLGRKGTLVASLLLMGISTFLIGFLPPAQGFWTVMAPLALVLLRFAQGLGAASTRVIAPHHPSPATSTTRSTSAATGRATFLPLSRQPGASTSDPYLSSNISASVRANRRISGDPPFRCRAVSLGSRGTFRSRS